VLIIDVLSFGLNNKLTTLWHAVRELGELGDWCGSPFRGQHVLQLLHRLWLPLFHPSGEVGPQVLGGIEVGGVRREVSYCHDLRFRGRIVQGSGRYQN